MYQRRLFSTEGLQRATFWMQPEVLQWFRRAAKESGLSQAALLNAIIIDFMIRRADEDLQSAPDEHRADLTRLKKYIKILLENLPKINIPHL